jgi:hypothetical protein
VLRLKTIWNNAFKIATIEIMKNAKTILPLFVFLISLITVSSPHAQTADPSKQKDRHLYFLINHDDLPDNATLKEMLKEPDFLPFVEPTISPVKFLAITPAESLRARADRLLQGIYIDVPPQYDHYGYEIRRYMASVFNPAVPGNAERLEEEIKNVRKAKVILKYWRDEIRKEISSIREEIEENTATDATTRSTFKYNSGIADAFMLECQSWLDNNEAVLKFLAKHFQDYSFNDPIFIFDTKEQRLEFMSLYKARLSANQQIVRYAPFRSMVY